MTTLYPVPVPRVIFWYDKLKTTVPRLRENGLGSSVVRNNIHETGIEDIPRIVQRSNSGKINSTLRIVAWEFQVSQKDISVKTVETCLENRNKHNGQASDNEHYTIERQFLLKLDPSSHRKTSSSNSQIAALQPPRKILGGDEVRREPTESVLVDDLEHRRVVDGSSFLVAARLDIVQLHGT
jgi:hypothetical protein